MKIIVIKHFNGRVRFVPRIFHVQMKQNIRRKSSSELLFATTGQRPPGWISFESMNP